MTIVAYNMMSVDEYVSLLYHVNLQENVLSERQPDSIPGPVHPPSCLPVRSVSFFRGFSDNTNIYHCWGVL